MRRITPNNRLAAGLLAGFFTLLPLTSQVASQELEAREKQSREQLQTIELERTISEQRKQELAREIDALEKDRETLTRKLIESSARSRQIETTIQRTNNRLDELEVQAATLRASLGERKGVLVEVIAALQRMGRNPPPALLVTPQDALSSVRSAILLGAVVPEIRAETEILLVELRGLNEITNEISAKQAVLETDLAKLAEEDQRLNLLLSEKQKLAASAKTALATESARAAELAAKATSLSKLIDSIENEIKSVRDAAEAAKEAEEQRKKAEAERIATGRKIAQDPDFQDLTRISPAIAFAEAKGRLPRPVSGAQLIGFGEKDDFGEVSSGISLDTRRGASVSSPADGWVIYAGPFRTYGKLLILNAGDGYRIVLAGMEQINVQLGQFVLRGEPIGTMGDAHANGNIIPTASTRPILYVEFRKGETPVDPTPWWADKPVKVASDDS